jgi:hypothetical protein
MHSFSVAINVLLLGVATVVSALPIAESVGELELKGRGSFIATFKLILLLVLTGI